MCASIRPGHTNLPLTSTSRTPSYSPTPAISPSDTAMSPTQNSEENTFRYVAFFSTRSAFIRFAATFTSFCFFASFLATFSSVRSPM